MLTLPFSGVGKRLHPFNDAPSWGNEFLGATPAVERNVTAMGEDRTTVPSMSENEIYLPPSAPDLLESMRAIGYSFESALADLIDNSIAARAQAINIRFSVAGEPYVAIIDDGIGMSPAELKNAMRHGSTNPGRTRDAHDLGRFGFGLKTASLSVDPEELPFEPETKIEFCAADEGPWAAFKGPAIMPSTAVFIGGFRASVRARSTSCGTVLRSVGKPDNGSSAKCESARAAARNVWRIVNGSQVGRTTFRACQFR